MEPEDRASFRPPRVLVPPDCWEQFRSKFSRKSYSPRLLFNQVASHLSTAAFGGAQSTIIDVLGRASRECFAEAVYSRA